MVLPRLMPAAGPNEVTTCVHVLALRQREEEEMKPAFLPHAGSSSSSSVTLALGFVVSAVGPIPAATAAATPATAEDDIDPRDT